MCSSGTAVHGDVQGSVVVEGGTPPGVLDLPRPRSVAATRGDGDVFSPRRPVMSCAAAGPMCPRRSTFRAVSLPNAAALPSSTVEPISSTAERGDGSNIRKFVQPVHGRCLGPEARAASASRKADSAHHGRLADVDGRAPQVERRRHRPAGVSMARSPPRHRYVEPGTARRRRVIRHGRRLGVTIPSGATARALSFLGSARASAMCR